MQKDDLCRFHAAHTNDINRNKKDIQDLFKMNEKQAERFDSMKNMLIIGLGSSLLQLTILIVGVVFTYIKFK